MKKNSWRNLFKWLIFSFLVLIIGILFCDYWIEKSTKNQLIENVEDVPVMKTALVLGTSKHVVGGNINLYFRYRMEAAAALYHAGKIKYILVSGDNSVVEYNESDDMKEYLIDLKIPPSIIIEDFAGFSTLDSVVRAKEVFGQDSIIIVSQPFHNERALFIANYYDIHAVGFNAQEVPQAYSLKTNSREYLARVKAILDVWILHRMPKFYKEKEDFPE